MGWQSIRSLAQKNSFPANVGMNLSSVVLANCYFLTSRTTPI